MAARWQASAIVVQTGTSLLPMVVRSLATGLPTAVYLHNVETHQLAGTLTPDPSLRYFANSDFTAERWRALCGIDCCVIPPIIDAERYLVAQTGEQVLFVNPTPIKGVKSLLPWPPPARNCRFGVRKLEPRPSLARALPAARRALGNVRWQAPTLDMRQAYAQARVLLMPSIWEESFGRTVIEAQLNGLPVLASHRVLCRRWWARVASPWKPTRRLPTGRKPCATCMPNQKQPAPPAANRPCAMWPPPR